MIRIRNETGVRSRRDIPTHTLAPPDWVRLAVFCASLQARSLIESGKRKVRVSSAKESEPEIDLLYLYEVGLVELIAWDEHDRTRKLLKIRRADLSLRAAKSLVVVGLLPRCFLPVLMSEDLLEDICPAASAELVAEEFAAWIECGGLSDDQDTMQQISGVLDASSDLDTEAVANNSPDEYAGLLSARLQSQHTQQRNVVAGLKRTLGVCAML